MNQIADGTPQATMGDHTNPDLKNTAEFKEFLGQPPVLNQFDHGQVVQGASQVDSEDVSALISSATNKQILDLLAAMQENQLRLEKKIADLESRKADTELIRQLSQEQKFIGSIDQGTTSTRFLIFNKEGHPVSSHQIEFKQIYPNSGWHEHDPEELVDSVKTCIEVATAQFERKGFSLSAIKAVGITNQRETTVVWDKTTGEPLYNAIVWTDARTRDLIHELKKREGADKLQHLCGLPLSTYPSVSKLLWLLDNVPRVQEAYNNGTLAFGTVDTWLVYKLNGGPQNNVMVTDPTNASRTMLMNLSTCYYEKELFKFFQLDQSKLNLAKIVKSSDAEAYGKLSDGALKGTRIMGCLGDQSAALVGQKGFSPGAAKNTYGTGCFLLYNVGDKPVISTHGLLATVAYDFDGKPVYALEGSIAVAGSGIKFLINNLDFIPHSSKISELAETVEDNGGCIFVTAFSGLFAPYWIDEARGTICKFIPLHLFLTGNGS